MARKISYYLFALAILTTIALHLGAPLLTGLFAYLILNVTHRNLSKKIRVSISRWLSVLIFTLTAILLSWLFWIFIRLTVSRVPLILSEAMPKILGLASNYSISLPFDDPQGLKALILENVKENARSITLESFVLTKGFFQVIVAAFVAIFLFFEGSPEPVEGTLFDAVYSEFSKRVSLFMEGFEKVFGAQIIVALVNTLLTASLVIVFRLPFFRFLSLSTFMFGLLPVIGNLISNALIAGTALMLSPQHAVGVLIALVILHKTEYILSSRIVSSSVNLPTWQMLIGILVGEILLGVPGIILAPAVITHLRKEMRAIGYKPDDEEAKT